MDAKDLRIEPALIERSSDGSKYAQSGTAFQCNRNKSYQDIGSNSSTKVDAPTARPCAIIGPDRVVPPTEPNDAYLKKAPVEPWPCPETVYPRPPEYPHKAVGYHNPTRNISPRQTFQENMQRIMVPPTYNSVKVNEDAGFIQKLNVTSDTKYCDVPYPVNPPNNDPKNLRSAEMCLPNVNPALGRPPHGWPPGGINIRPQRPYVSPDVYQYPDYPSCAGPRAVSISRPHRTIPEESGFMYPDHYYQEPNIRFKPYPNVKERYPQQRYDYVSNYSGPFHPPPPCPPQKYEISKSLPPHPYAGYPHFKYIDSRMSESILEGHQRLGGQQGSYNIAYRNQILHPAYGPMMTNNSQPKIPPYPPEGSFKAVASNKLPYDNSKIYVEYDNAKTKPLPLSEGFYPNEMSRQHAIPKGAMPNYASINIHTLPPHAYYKKDNSQIKNYEYINHAKNLNHSINMNSPMPLQRHMPQFSPNAIAISPTDSNTSNDTAQTHSISQDDCGYVSQSSTTSIRSIDLVNSRMPIDYYGRFYDPRYGHVIRAAPPLPKTNRNSSSGSTDNKEKKDMDVRKFLQMWNEGDDDSTENNTSKDIVVQSNADELKNTAKSHGVMNNQEQLYVLGLVNVPSEELSKYEHIQKVSKLPENIKGYNSIELLNQFEEVIESSNMNGFKLPTSKEFQAPIKQYAPKQSIAILPRPISPLDVEAKISQSVIHKEVGCNFEIKPCSPKMLNVEIAAPVQNILNERVIEKVTNPITMITSPILSGIDNIDHCKINNVRQDQQLLENSEEISSCKMINTQYTNHNTHAIKTNYSIQDLESNAGVCLASLPRLDNDIELNFPEVNQQFINANKAEPETIPQIKDLPELNDLEQTGKILNNIKSENFDTSALSPKFDTEREFTKLSKYRKMKTNISDGKLDKSTLKAIRTNSVIIKNPENTKALEIDRNQSRINDIKSTDQQLCTDLNSQVELVMNNICCNNETKVDASAYNSPEVAIDFRLHRGADKKCEFNQNITKKYEDVQFSKEDESLSKTDQYRNNDEESKCLEINKVDMLDEEISSVISSIDKDSENNSTTIQQSTNPNIVSSESSCETENLDVPDILNKLNITSELPMGGNIIKSQNVNENEISELQKPVEDIDKTIILTYNKNEKETAELQIERNVSSPNEIIQNEIRQNEDVTCDILHGQCEEIKPKEDTTILVRVEIPESYGKDDIPKDVNKHTLQNQSTTLSPTLRIQEEQSDNSEIQESFDNTDETLTEPLGHKANWDLHNESSEFYDSKHNDEISDMTNLDEGFGSIDEKQSCENITVFNYDTDIEHTNYINVKNNIKSVAKCSGYGSKELYSPWIQKLIMFNEGVCCSLSFVENTLSVDNLPVNQKSDNIDSSNCSSNLSDPSIEITESTVSENTSNTSNDSTIQFKNNLKNETITKESSIHCNQLNVQIEVDDEILDQQNMLSENIQSDKDLNDINEEETVRDLLFHANDETVKDVLLEVQNENKPYNTTPETDISGKNKESYNDLDIRKQTTETFDKYAIEKHEYKHNTPSTVTVTKHRKNLKRSLSDSALNVLHSETQPERDEFSVIWPFKRSKPGNENDSEIIAQNLCSILQHNRRNSISAMYNEDVSFCILIEDNSILTETNDESNKLCYTELTEDCLNEINNTYTCEENDVDITIESVTRNDETNCEYSNTITLNGDHDIASDGTWVEDVACMETVVSDDIAEDIVISSVSSPQKNIFWDDDESNNYANGDEGDDIITDSPKYDDEVIIHSDPEILKLCETPQIDMDKTFIPRVSQNSAMYMGFYDNESLERILSESNQEESPRDNTESVTPSDSPKRTVTPDNKENMNITLSKPNTNEIDNKINHEHSRLKMYENIQDVNQHSSESSFDNVFAYNQRDDSIDYKASSSPEVSSTTSEEKSSSLLLKITNYKGTKVSQINTLNLNNKISCKFTEKTDYVNPNIKLNSNRPLITKAAQKYIPPLKEDSFGRRIDVHDLKVKLSLPQQSLLKLKQMKTSKDEPKLNKQTTVPSRLPKKPKPKFEDVLKSIDEIQIKMHKEKTKKVKKAIPKVVIKKSENGSHYASTSNRDAFNPDLTGRKWQPWVFLEKSNFIDKMAIRRKTKAIFSHRKNMYVLAEKFHKYKSASSTKFVISHPKFSGSSTGQLKYTIRLKHSY